VLLFSRIQIAASNDKEVSTVADFSKNLTESFVPYFDLIVFILNVLSIIILIWGVILAVKDFLTTERAHLSRIELAAQNNLIKNFLGSYVLLSLEVLIAADIIESIINPTWVDILRLSAVVVIRTVISYFLHQEIEDAKK
jgi:uncharacterized membrane protein